VPTDDINAISFGISGRDFGVSATSTRADRRDEDQRGEDRGTRSAPVRRPTSQDPSNHHEPAEEQHDADPDDRRVLAHVAGLALAHLGGGRLDRDGLSDAVDGTVDDLGVEVGNRLEPSRPGLPMNHEIAAS
jgi:hypothetical protein